MNSKLPVASQSLEQVLLDKKIFCPLLALDNENKITSNTVPSLGLCGWDRCQLSFPVPVVHPQPRTSDSGNSCEAKLPLITKTIQPRSRKRHHRHIKDHSRFYPPSQSHIDVDQGRTPEDSATWPRGNIQVLNLDKERYLLHVSGNNLVASFLPDGFVRDLPLTPAAEIPLNNGPIHQIKVHNQKGVFGTRDASSFTLWRANQNETARLGLDPVFRQKVSSQNPVQDFSFSPYIEDELCILSSKTLQLIRNNSSFFKHTFDGRKQNFVDCCYASHPNCVLLWHKDGIFRVDSRDHVVSSVVTFKDARWHPLYNIQKDEHICCGERSVLSNILYGATQNSLFLWDERMGSQPIEKFAHRMQHDPHSLSVASLNDWHQMDFVLLTGVVPSSVTGIGISRKEKKPFGLLTSPTVEMRLQKLPSLPETLKDLNLQCKGFDEEIELRFQQPLSGVCCWPFRDGIEIFTATFCDVFHQEIKFSGSSQAVQHLNEDFLEEWMALCRKTEENSATPRMKAAALFKNKQIRGPDPVDGDDFSCKLQTRLPRNIQKFQNLDSFSDEYSKSLVAAWNSSHSNLQDQMVLESPDPLDTTSQYSNNFEYSLQNSQWSSSWF